MTDVHENQIDVDLVPGSSIGIPWDFASDASLGTGFTPGVTVLATIERVQEDEDDLNTASTDLGNDAPEIVDLQLPLQDLDAEEVVGIADLRFVLADTSSDRIDVEARFRVASDSSGAWHRATPAGDSELTDLASAPATASGGGTEHTFFWDVQADLPGSEHVVQVRLQPTDLDEGGEPLAEGEAAQSAFFRVDNNAAPVALLNGSAFAFEADHRRGIPIPFTLSDSEGDLVRYFIQWRRPEQDFDGDLALGGLDDIESVLGDPEMRRVKQIADPADIAIVERVRSAPGLDDRELWIPELSTSAAILRDANVAGDHVEILRGHTAPRPTGEDALEAPAAAVPLGNGELAAVLVGGEDGWRLEELRLATLQVERTIATGAGVGSAVALDPSGESVWVGSDQQGSWRIERVHVASGDVTPFVAYTDLAGAPPGKLRGLASLGTGALLATVGDSLVRVDPGAVEAVVAILEDLDLPWGVAVDPRRPDMAYVAQNEPAGTGSVLAVDLHRSHASPLNVGDALSNPQVIALENDGGRLLIVGEDGEQVQLQAVELGGPDPSEPSVLGSYPSGGAPLAGSVACGPDGLRVLVLPLRGELVIGGGVVQRRTIESLDPATQRLTVTEPFDPHPTGDERWRIALRSAPESIAGWAGPVSVTGGETSEVFLWDSSDVVGGGDAFLRLVPFDTELGSESRTVAPMEVRTSRNDPPLRLGIQAPFGQLPLERSAGSVLLADLDDDGALDIARLRRENDATPGFPITNTVTVFRQAGPLANGSDGSFLQSFDIGEQLERPTDAVAGDFDGDGRTDVVVANAPGLEPDQGNPCEEIYSGDPGFLTRHLQGPTGDPPAYSEQRFAEGEVEAPRDLAAADLDADGDLDLACADSRGHEIVLFENDGSGSFVVSARVGAPGVTDGARAVATADMDGDGRLDLVSANFDRDDVTVFLQGASGGFGPAPDAVLDGSFRRPAALAVTDLDGDGRADVASANHDGLHGVAVFSEIAFGLGPQPPTMTGDVDFFFCDRPAHWIEAADLDGDSRLDLVVANEFANAIQVFFQHPDGSFGSPAGSFDDVPVAIADMRLGGVEQVVSLAVGDLDADGGLDVVSANRVRDNVRVHFRRGAGVFTLATSSVLGGPTLTDDPFALAVGDVDGNGLPDIVSGHKVAGDLLIHYQDRPRVFQPDPAGLLGTGEDLWPTGVEVADLDGDGRSDLVACLRTGKALRVFFQLDEGGFESTPDQEIQTPYSCFDLAVDDLDADGAPDAVVSQYNKASEPGGAKSSIEVYLNTGHGLPSRPSYALATVSEDDSPRGLRVADVDGDGRLDIANTNEEGASLSIYYQNGDGSFGTDDLPDERLELAPGTTPFELVATDLDGNGRVDLASANRNDRSISIFYQQEAKQFAERVDLVVDVNDAISQGSGNDPTTIHAADVDLDGDVDLVTANADSSSVAVFLQTSGGRFHQSLRVEDSVQTICCPNRMRIADVDLDGDPDLVVANSGPCSSLTVLWGSHGAPK